MLFRPVIIHTSQGTSKLKGCFNGQTSTCNRSSKFKLVYEYKSKLTL